MVATPANAAGRGNKTKQVNLTSQIRIIRTRSDFEAFLESEKAKSTPGQNEEFDACTDFVLHGRVSNVNKTKAPLEQPGSQIAVPSTIMHKDETVEALGFIIPRTYIRFIQHRHSQTGIKITESISTHYNLYKKDFEFVEGFNKRFPDTPITLGEFCLLMDAFEKGAIKHHKDKSFSYELALMVARDNGNLTPAYVVREVHAYWSLRRGNHALPFVRHLWPITLTWESSAFPVFRPRTKEKMLLRRPRRSKVESILRLFRIIDGFRKVLKLLSKMRQRDEKKLMVAQLEIVLFDQRCNEREDESYVCPFWRSILDQKRSRALKKLRAELTKKESNTDSISSSVKRLQKLQMSGQSWSSAQLDECIPDNESYRSLRISRRIGRGGRIWIDRRRVYNRQNAPEHARKQPFPFLSDEDSGEDAEREFAHVTNRTGDFNVYTNERQLEYHPGFACTHEAMHPYNTGGMFHYQIPEYLVRQLEIIKLLDAVLPSNSESGNRRIRPLGNYEGFTQT
ncbi:hypothetical protein BgAZ_205050 [Babesia gibsoni]|uniref:Enhancer of polycomb-like protein n=1 Tax=Babesia gibsoni TaxID=33632 RepID=A0AAD8PDZ1_BABGI|nr:hypothetical protein BgAZ_205050 [Babesia gibsoni]